MRGDLLDLILLVLVVAFAVSGYRQGFIVGSLSFLGFVGGGVLGVFIAPPIARAVLSEGPQQALLALVIVFVTATVGQFAASTVAAVVRSHVTWNPARTVDALGGVLASVLSVLITAWLIASLVERSPLPLFIREQVTNSQVLGTVNEAMPDIVRSWTGDVKRLIDTSEFPQVFAPFDGGQLVDVPPPDESVLTTAPLQRARRSIVKVRGVAPDCGKSIEGTGFVYAPQRIMTNAHVVAGVQDELNVLAEKRSLPARVVIFDPERDVAVLFVPGLNVPALDFDGGAKSRDEAIVAGFPRGHGFTVRPARVRAKQVADSLDIYQERTVRREVYALRAIVEPGNSGGPLLAPDGRVYGVIFAAATDRPETGYALTAKEVALDAEAGLSVTRPVSTQSCDT